MISTSSRKSLQPNITQALRHGRPFNVIHIPTVLKFDFFPAAAYPLGTRELDRAVLLDQPELSPRPIPFVTPEDILLAKMYGFKPGGEVSAVQWRDIEGLVRNASSKMDRGYLLLSAAELRIPDLLNKAMTTRAADETRTTAFSSMV